MFPTSRDVAIYIVSIKERHSLGSSIIVHIERKAPNDCGSYGAANMLI